MYEEVDVFGELTEEPRGDPAERQARAALIELFENQKERVYFTRQLEIMLEKRFFHWITGRAIRGLQAEGKIRSEVRELRTGAQIKLLWHRSYRYPKRAAAAVVKRVDSYSDPSVARAIGRQGEAHAFEGFASKRFTLRGRDVREYNGITWEESEHDMDFIFERDGRAYGVEVKNKLGYMELAEMRTKVRMCKHLGLLPVFVVRMAPATWIDEVRRADGFTLVLKYQLYPWGHEELARAVREELELPVDAPKRLEEGTMRRFEAWHERSV